MLPAPSPPAAMREGEKMLDTDEAQSLRLELEALRDADTLHMLPKEAHIASIKYLAEQALILLSEARDNALLVARNEQIAARDELISALRAETTRFIAEVADLQADAVLARGMASQIARLQARVDAVRALCDMAYRSGPEPWLDARDVRRAVDAGPVDAS